MSIFSAIGNFFKKIFNRVRPGLDHFLQKYEQIALDEVKRLATIHDGKGLHEWKDEAFNVIKAEVAKDVKEIKDNWISILLHFAFEELKVIK